MNDPSTLPAQRMRLRPTVQSRILPNEGLAISAGAGTVVINGTDATPLWRAIEPHLRRGVSLNDLVNAFPANGRSMVRSLLAEFSENRLLHEVENDVVLEPQARRAAETRPYFEAQTHRPNAAVLGVATGRIRVSGRRTTLSAAIVAMLLEVGFASVEDAGTGTPTDTRDPDVIEIERQEEEGWRLAVVIVASAGVTVLGPLNRKPTSSSATQISERLCSRAVTTGYRPPGVDAERMLHTLLAAQVVLASLAGIARDTDARQPPDGAAGQSWPQFMVTVEELISEPHTLVALEHPEVNEFWIPVSRADLGVDPRGPNAVTALESLTGIWDSALGCVREPRPGTLTQLPVGLAESGVVGSRVTATLIGCGVTTADARLDALMSALTEFAAIPAPASPGKPTGAALGVGLSLGAASAAAIATLAHGLPAASWAAATLPDNAAGARARRLHAALTLRFGQECEVTASRLNDGGGLVKVEVSCNATPTGVAVGTTLATALDGALLRAVAHAQFQAEPRTVGGGDISRLDRSSTEVVTELVGWARTTGAPMVRLSTPTHSPTWRSAGLYLVVATWTE